MKINSTLLYTKIIIKSILKNTNLNLYLFSALLFFTLLSCKSRSHFFNQAFFCLQSLGKWRKGKLRYSVVTSKVGNKHQSSRSTHFGFRLKPRTFAVFPSNNLTTVNCMSTIRSQYWSCTTHMSVRARTFNENRYILLCKVNYSIFLSLIQGLLISSHKRFPKKYTI